MRMDIRHTVTTAIWALFPPQNDQAMASADPKTPTPRLDSPQAADCLSEPCSLSELREWVAYSKQRASLLHAEAAAWNRDTDTYRRLKTKAGCFRSLAIEVERIIEAND